MKLEKPLEEEMDLLLGEIPNATSAPAHVHHHPIPMPHAHHHHHHAPIMMYASSDPSSSSSSSPSSRSSPLSPANDEVSAADLLARLHSLQLRSGANPNFLNPYPYPFPLLYHHPLLRRPYRAAAPGLARPALHSDATFILDGRTGPAAAGKKRLEGCGGGSGGGGINLLRFENLVEIPGYIYHCAKDQSGCRLLQRKFEEGRRQDVDRIFNGIIGHVADLMMNPFGNYLVQKLLDVCTEEQRMRIVIKLTHDHPSDIIRVSLNTHGTRVVQKLIETLKTQQQIRLVVSALKPGFIQLIKDLNGNHVIQRCLQSLSAEDNKFIFDAAARHCVDIATHRHGCCVLQRCITYSTGEYRSHLVDEISANGLLLAQDAFGNYVVQFILDLKNPSATANLASQFEGNYVHLSTQKFSSNVVEKCLKLFTDSAQARIVCELLAFTRFEMLLQDPYANYVIQSALAHTKGGLHAALVHAIRPHAAILRTSPYSKRIFSQTQLKK